MKNMNKEKTALTERIIENSGRAMLWERLAWIPVILFATAIGVIYRLNIKVVAEHHLLLTLMNLFFCIPVALLTSYLAARSYLIKGEKYLLFIGSGMLAWGIGAGLSLVMVENINMLLTVHNIGACLAGAGCLAGAVSASGFSRSGKNYSVASDSVPAISYVGIGVFMFFIAAGWGRLLLPPFFVPGFGVTMVRQFVLGAATVQFFIAAFIFRLLYARSRDLFLHWFSLGLLLLGVGLFGVWLTIPGTPLNWTARAAQFLAGPYILIAIINVKRKLGKWGISLEEALQESERQQEALIRFAPTAICEIDFRKKKLTSVNDAMCRMLGYSRKELLSMDPFDFFDQEGKRLFQATIDQWQKGEKPDEQVEFKIRTQDGRQLFVELKVTFKKDEKGNPTGAFVIGHDVTERKRAEEVLYRERSLLDTIMRATDVMLVFLDPQFNFMWVNTAYAEACKKKPEELIGKNHFALYPHAENEAIFQKVRETGTGVFYKDKPFVFSDQPERGTTYWDWSLTPVKNAENEIKGLVFSLRETTKYKQAEFQKDAALEALRASEARLKLAQISAGAGIWDWDIPSGKLEWSEEFFRLFGLDPQEAAATFETWRSVLYPDDKQIAEQRIETSIEQHTPLVNEYRIVLPSGEVRWINALGNTTYDENGNPQRMSGICIDITGRKRLELQIKNVAEKFSSLFNATSDGILIHTLNGEILEVNDAYCRMSGYSREEFNHMAISELEAVEQPREIVRHIKKVIKQGGHDRFESRHRRKDGSVFDVDITALYLEREGGRIVMFMRDITERKKLLNLLETKSKEQEVILDSFPAMMFYKDKENRLLRVNKAFEKIMNFSPGSLDGKSVFDLYPKEQAEAFWRDDREVLKSGKPKRGIIEPMETPQGTRIVETDKIPYIDDQGNIIGIIGFAIDITERKRAEEAEKWSLRRQEILSQTAARLLGSEDPQSLIQDICRQVMEFLDCQVFFNFLAGERAGQLHLNACAGIPRKETRRIEWLDYGTAVSGCVARDCKRIVAENILNTGDPQTDLVRYYGIQAYCCHPLIAQGRLIGTLSFGTRSRTEFSPKDIEVMETVSHLVAIAINRIEIETTLSESRRDLERAQEVGNIGNWRMDVKRNNLVWSDETYRIFGVPSDTLLTYEIFLSVVHPDDRAYVDQKWKAAMAGEDYDIEHRIIAGGKVKWIREKAFLEFDKNGDFLAGFGIAQDITSRKQAEKNLRESEERLRLAARAAHFGTYDANLVAGTLYWSPEMKVILGLPLDAPAPQPGAVPDFVYPEDVDHVKKMFRKAFDPAGNGVVLYEHRILRTDGNLRWVQFRGQVEFTGKGTRRRAVRSRGMMMDITGRKMAEEVLSRDKEILERLVEERSQQLVDVHLELERAKRLSDIGVLAATVAHELRNPLAAINMAAHNIQRKVKNAGIDKNLASINKKVAESDQIINNLLFYSHLKPPHYEKIHIFDVLEESLGSVQLKAKKNVSIIKNIGALKDVSIEADPLQMREVFNNILDNAFDAVPPDTGEIKIISKDEKDSVEIKIDDNGAGIEKEILSRIFDPFFTTKAKGTGLGLCVCRQIINFHNGSISVQSEIGKGTCVSVHLPKKKKKKEMFGPARFQNQ